MALNVSCQVPPPWLDHEFVKNVLKKSECDESIRVKSVSGKAATANGDNYMSEMIRIRIEFTRNRLGREITDYKSFILKVEPDQDSFSGDLAKLCEFFDTEIKMMSDTLIEMTEAVNEKDVRFGARVYYAEIGDPSFIAMEDLGALGFRMADRKNGLDLPHCRLAIERLAKFHASSVAVYEKNPDIAEIYSKTIYNGGEKIRSIVRGAMVSLAIESAKWEELNPSYSKKLYKLAEVCFDKTIKCTIAREGEFNVINHADCWVNNLLFRYNDKGEVVDQIFVSPLCLTDRKRVDFQHSARGSPAVDLIYFLMMSTRDDVADHHYDELLGEYLKTLTSTMLRIGCKTKPPTLESFHKSLQERRILEVVYSSLVLPFVLLDESEVAKLSDLVDPETSGQVTPGYKGKRFRQKITKRLKQWDLQGLLDV